MSKIKFGFDKNGGYYVKGKGQPKEIVLLILALSKKMQKELKLSSLDEVFKKIKKFEKEKIEKVEDYYD